MEYGCFLLILDMYDHTDAKELFILSRVNVKLDLGAYDITSFYLKMLQCKYFINIKKGTWPHKGLQNEYENGLVSQLEACLPSIHEAWVHLSVPHRTRHNDIPLQSQHSRRGRE